jgi:hypothetical protein
LKYSVRSELSNYQNIKISNMVWQCSYCNCLVGTGTPLPALVLLGDSDIRLYIPPRSFYINFGDRYKNHSSN